MHAKPLSGLSCRCSETSAENKHVFKGPSPSCNRIPVQPPFNHIPTRRRTPYHISLPRPLQSTEPRIRVHRSHGRRYQLCPDSRGCLQLPSSLRTTSRECGIHAGVRLARELCLHRRRRRARLHCSGHLRLEADELLGHESKLEEDCLQRRCRRPLYTTARPQKEPCYAVKSRYGRFEQASEVVLECTEPLLFAYSRGSKTIPKATIAPSACRPLPRWVRSSEAIVSSRGDVSQSKHVVLQFRQRLDAGFPFRHQPLQPLRSTRTGSP